MVAGKESRASAATLDAHAGLFPALREAAWQHPFARVATALVIAAGVGAFAWHAWQLAAWGDAQRLPGVAGYLALETWLLVVSAALAAGVAIVDCTVRRVSAPATLAAGAAMGMIAFVGLIGWRLVVPSDTAWITGGDLGQHYAGWEFFRRDAWRWPPGANMGYAHPVGTSVVYTDSMPLYALALKPFRASMGPTFQYTGLVWLGAWLLQGAAAAALARAAGLRAAAAIAFAGLMALQAVLVFRIGHDSLTWQWLLLAGLALNLAAARGVGSVRARLAGSLALVSIAALVHPYLAAMTMLLAVALLWRCRRAGALTTRAVLGLFAAHVATVLCLWWIAGAFVLPSVGRAAGVEMGMYSSNLLALFDSGGFSRWFPTLPDATGGQYEGRAYPGLGGWLVIVAGAALLLWRAPRARLRALAPLAIVLLATWAFAISPKPAIGSHVLFDLSGWTPRVLEAFHSSGRFVWPVLYGLFALALLGLARAPRLAAPLLAAALALQAYEYAPIHGYTATMRSGQRPVESPVLDDPRWAALAQRRDHLLAVPARHCGTPPLPNFSLASLAIRHDLTLNDAYLARGDTEGQRAACTALSDELSRGQWRADSLYVFAANGIPPTPAHVRCTALDDVVACRADVAP